MSEIGCVERPAIDKEAVVDQRHYCNNCGKMLYYPERGIVPFDGRFCGVTCLECFEMKKIRYWSERCKRIR